MVSRSCLLILLAKALGGSWGLEQPASSRLCWYPCFEHVLLKMKTYRVAWWMRHYGSLSPYLCRNFKPKRNLPYTYKNLTSVQLSSSKEKAQGLEQHPCHRSFRPWKTQSGCTQTVHLEGNGKETQEGWNTQLLRHQTVETNTAWASIVA